MLTPMTVKTQLCETKYCFSSAYRKKARLHRCYLAMSTHCFSSRWSEQPRNLLGQFSRGERLTATVSRAFSLTSAKPIRKVYVARRSVLTLLLQDSAPDASATTCAAVKTKSPSKPSTAYHRCKKAPKPRNEGTLLRPACFTLPQFPDGPKLDRKKTQNRKLAARTL